MSNTVISPLKLTKQCQPASYLQEERLAAVGHDTQKTHDVGVAYCSHHLPFSHKLQQILLLHLSLFINARKTTSSRYQILTSMHK